MPAPDEYTPEEWSALTAAPMMAGMLITTADISGPVGLVQEASAIARATIEEGGRSSSMIVKTIAADLRANKPPAPDLPKDRAAAQAALIDRCKHAAAIVAEKAPDQTDAFKNWLVEVADKTAHASKEGGFLGFGGTRVSTGERTALDALRSALGLAPAAPS